LPHHAASDKDASSTAKKCIHRIALPAFHERAICCNFNHRLQWVQMSLPNSFADSHVCIVGLGYVGLTLAVAMADTGFQVHGLEKRNDVLEGLEFGQPHFWEPRLKEKLARVKRRGAFTFSDTLTAQTKASVYIITVGTPLDKQGNARLDMAEDATRQVIAHMEEGALIILRSTVKLGTARNVVKRLLDQSGKRYQIAFCPERTLEGKALIELHELPQVIGADDPDTRWRCQQLFGQMTATTVAVSSLEAAELVKLVDNTYRDLTFGFANEIAKLCSRAGLSAHEVIRAGKLGYPRTNVALPGPVGGPCLEKDPHILVESAKQWGVSMPVTLAGRLTNEEQPADIASIAKGWSERMLGFSKSPRISLLGLAFKGVPATDDLRGTMAMPIYKALRAAFPTAAFSSYDPVVTAEATREFFGFDSVPSLAESFAGADLVIIMNNHAAFQQMDLPGLATQMARPGIVYDLWNMHDIAADAMPEGVIALSLGGERL
jgi:UDP-N-acetyl-D-mannosaminuronic acid dehydrogenase